jgi:hypothetical protein
MLVAGTSASDSDIDRTQETGNHPGDIESVNLKQTKGIHRRYPTALPNLALLKDGRNAGEKGSAEEQEKCLKGIGSD